MIDDHDNEADSPYLGIYSFLYVNFLELSKSFLQPWGGAPTLGRMCSCKHEAVNRLKEYTSFFDSERIRLWAPALLLKCCQTAGPFSPPDVETSSMPLVTFEWRCKTNSVTEVLYLFLWLFMQDQCTKNTVKLILSPVNHPICVSHA